MNSTSGKLTTANGDEGGTKEWKLDAVELFKKGRTTEARKLMCNSARPEEMEEVFRWLYDNLELWSLDVEKQDQAIVIIRNGMANIPLVADPEINLSATIIELCQLEQQ
jgi:hypothetical protein